ncbi:MAG TPA: hypothetical protein VF242_04610 [Nitrososphaeraceae archaeon]
MMTLIDGMQNSVLVLESSKSGWKTHEITILKIKHIRFREIWLRRNTICRKNRKWPNFF